jgi:hypothetical protein
MANEDVVKTLERGLELTLADIRKYMASPEGREMRERVAKGLIISAPLLLRIPFVRATPAGRLIGAFGGAALIAKLARSLRDWEPTVDIRPVP